MEKRIESTITEKSTLFEKRINAISKESTSELKKLYVESLQKSYQAVRKIPNNAKKQEDLLQKLNTLYEKSELETILQRYETRNATIKNSLKETFRKRIGEHIANVSTQALSLVESAKNIPSEKVLSPEEEKQQLLSSPALSKETKTLIESEFHKETESKKSEAIIQRLSKTMSTFLENALVNIHTPEEYTTFLEEKAKLLLTNPRITEGLSTKEKQEVLGQLHIQFLNTLVVGFLGYKSRTEKNYGAFQQNKKLQDTITSLGKKQESISTPNYSDELALTLHTTNTLLGSTPNTLSASQKELQKKQEHTSILNDLGIQGLKEFLSSTELETIGRSRTLLLEEATYTYILAHKGDITDKAKQESTVATCTEKLTTLKKEKAEIMQKLVEIEKKWFYAVNYKNGPDGKFLWERFMVEGEKKTVFNKIQSPITGNLLYFPYDEYEDAVVGNPNDPEKLKMALGTAAIIPAGMVTAPILGALGLSGAVAGGTALANATRIGIAFGAEVITFATTALGFRTLGNAMLDAHTYSKSYSESIKETFSKEFTREAYQEELFNNLIFLGGIKLGMGAMGKITKASLSKLTEIEGRALADKVQKAFQGHPEIQKQLKNLLPEGKYTKEGLIKVMELGGKEISKISLGELKNASPLLKIQAQNLAAEYGAFVALDLGMQTVSKSYEQETFTPLSGEELLGSLKHNAEVLLFLKLGNFLGKGLVEKGKEYGKQTDKATQYLRSAQENFTLFFKSKGENAKALEQAKRALDTAGVEIAKLKQGTLGETQGEIIRLDTKLIHSYGLHLKEGTGITIEGATGSTIETGSSAWKTFLKTKEGKTIEPKELAKYPEGRQALKEIYQTVGHEVTHRTLDKLPMETKQKLIDIVNSQRTEVLTALKYHRESFKNIDPNKPLQTKDFHLVEELLAYHTDGSLPIKVPGMIQNMRTIIFEGATSLKGVGPNVITNKLRDFQTKEGAMDESFWFAMDRVTGEVKAKSELVRRQEEGSEENLPDNIKDPLQKLIKRNGENDLAQKDKDLPSDIRETLKTELAKQNIPGDFFRKTPEEQQEIITGIGENAKNTLNPFREHLSKKGNKELDKLWEDQKNILINKIVDKAQIRYAKEKFNLEDAPTPDQLKTAEQEINGNYNDFIGNTKRLLNTGRQTVKEKTIGKAKQALQKSLNTIESYNPFKKVKKRSTGAEETPEEAQAKKLDAIMKNTRTAIKGLDDVRFESKESLREKGSQLLEKLSSFVKRKKSESGTEDTSEQKEAKKKLTDEEKSILETLIKDLPGRKAEVLASKYEMTKNDNFDQFTKNQENLDVIIQEIQKGTEKETVMESEAFNELYADRNTDGTLAKETLYESIKSLKEKSDLLKKDYKNLEELGKRGEEVIKEKEDILTKELEKKENEIRELFENEQAKELIDDINNPYREKHNYDNYLSKEGNLYKDSSTGKIIEKSKADEYEREKTKLKEQAEHGENIFKKFFEEDIIGEKIIEEAKNGDFSTLEAQKNNGEISGTVTDINTGEKTSRDVYPDLKNLAEAIHKNEQKPYEKVNIEDIKSIEDSYSDILEKQKNLEVINQEINKRISEDTSENDDTSETKWSKKRIAIASLLITGGISGIGGGLWYLFGDKKEEKKNSTEEEPTKTGEEESNKTTDESTEQEQSEQFPEKLDTLLSQEDLTALKEKLKTAEKPEDTLTDYRSKDGKIYYDEGEKKLVKKEAADTYEESSKWLKNYFGDTGETILEEAKTGTKSQLDSERNREGKFIGNTKKADGTVEKDIDFTDEVEKHWNNIAKKKYTDHTTEVENMAKALATEVKAEQTEQNSTPANATATQPPLNPAGDGTNVGKEAPVSPIDKNDPRFQSTPVYETPANTTQTTPTTTETPQTPSTENPTGGTNPPEKEKSAPKGLTEEERKAILDSATDANVQNWNNEINNKDANHALKGQVEKHRVLTHTWERIDTIIRVTGIEEVIKAKSTYQNLHELNSKLEETNADGVKSNIYDTTLRNDFIRYTKELISIIITDDETHPKVGPFTDFSQELRDIYDGLPKADNLWRYMINTISKKELQYTPV